MQSSVYVRQKYITLVEISLVVLEIWKAEFSNSTVPVNSILVCCTSFFVFLAADTLLCVLIFIPSLNKCNEHYFISLLVSYSSYIHSLHFVSLLNLNSDNEWYIINNNKVVTITFKFLGLNGNFM